MDSQQWDAIVIGGGPGGAVAATLVAMQGHRVLLLEKHASMQHKIGESLLPSTVHGICPLLGVSDEIHRAGFVRKSGGTFVWGQRKEPWTFSFGLSSRMPGPTAFAYQVERIKFDRILLENAERKGVEVRRGCQVTGLVYGDRDRVTAVEMNGPSGQSSLAHGRFIVDASGHAMFAGRQVGERVDSEFFRNVAVFGYYHGGKRLPPPNSGNIFSVAFARGWFWYIPLSDTLTSVGAVIGREHAPLIAEGREAALSALIEECGPIRHLLRDAERVTSGIYGDVRVRKDYSYCHTKFWRPGLALVGDAACFVDPVFSSGVHLATYAGLLAARSINACLNGAVPEARAFDEFERRYRREFRYFYEFLLAFYNVDQDVESYYWAARRVLSSSDAARDAFINLVGGVGGSGEPLFEQSDEAFEERVTRGRDLFPQTAEDEQDAGSPERRTRFLTGMVGELTQLQTQALLGSRRLREAPLFNDGLIPSADGFSWSEPPR